MTNRFELISQRYGKARVRVLRVVRNPDGVQSVHEVTGSVMLQGDFSDAYLTDNNHQVVATDTMKNTVHVLAREHLTDVIEDFALVLGKHFLKKFDNVSGVDVELVSTPWGRYETKAGHLHPHAFVANGVGKPFTRVAVTRNYTGVTSGVRGVLVLKSTASSFKGFPRDELTTLPDADDRILSTCMDATWSFANPASDFAATNAAILPVLLETFAREFSPSVQNTLYKMGTAALVAAPAISTISLAMPNKHYLPINLQPFGLPNANEIFLPTDEPHGQIEATIGRASS